MYIFLLIALIRFLQRKIQHETIEMSQSLFEYSNRILPDLSILTSAIQSYKQYQKVHPSLPYLEFPIVNTAHNPEVDSTTLSPKKKPCLTIRNHKKVYSFIEQGELLSSSELPPDKKHKKSKRGSKYRGVSKNGNQWQVLIMINKKKKYIGNYSSEVKAAKIYDEIAIKYQGLKAKTNFHYTKDEIDSILAKEMKFKGV